MAEKGVLIADQSGGESVACRDATEQDDGSNNRIIQLVDTASRTVNFQVPDMIRTLTAGDSPDSNDLYALSTDIYYQEMYVGDADGIVLYGYFYMASSYSAGTPLTKVVVTPLLMHLTSNNRAMGALAPVEMKPVAPSGGTVTLADCLVMEYSGATSVYFQTTPIHACGANKLCFHVHFEGPATIPANSTLNIHASRVSQVQPEYAQQLKLSANAYGGPTIPDA